MNQIIRPKVDILIPFHGNYELVTKAIESIARCTPNNPYQIILCDDCSPNENYLNYVCKSNKKIKGKRLEKQGGFGKALEEGFSISTSNQIVIMHSDVQVENINWLINLQRSLNHMKNHGVKLISARTNDIGTANNFDPRLVGEAVHEFSGDIVVDSPLPLHCSIMHRDLFNRIGGFIKSYPYAWFEDVELFYRMKHYGFKQGISVNSFVKHKGGATIEKLSNKTRKLMENNVDLCLKDIKRFNMRS